jgi:hypothetical protein
MHLKLNCGEYWPFLSLCNPEHVDQVERLCRIGAIDEDIADFFSAHIDTIYEWKKVHSAFSDAIKRGKAVADQQVAEKLIDRATGAEYEEQVQVKLKEVSYDEQGRKLEKERVEIVTLKKEAPPDIPSGI